MPDLNHKKDIFNPYKSPKSDLTKMIYGKNKVFYIMVVAFLLYVIIGNYYFYSQILDTIKKYDIETIRPFFKQGMQLFFLTCIGFIFLIANYIYTFHKLSLKKALIFILLLVLAFSTGFYVFYNAFENIWIEALSFLIAKT